MKTEELIKRRQEENDGFTKVDGFAEYVSGIDNDELYILLSSLELAEDMLRDPWMAALFARMAEMRLIVQNEYVDRDLGFNGYEDDLKIRGNKVLGVSA